MSQQQPPVDKDAIKWEEKPQNQKKPEEAAAAEPKNTQKRKDADLVPKIPIPDFELTEQREYGYYSWFQERMLANPLVPIGALCTAAALAFGLRATARGDRVQSQLMMRYRVGFQFFTIVALVAGITISSMVNKDEDREEFRYEDRRP